MTRQVWETPHGVKLRPPTTTRAYYRLDYTLVGIRRQPSVGRDFDIAQQEAMRADSLLAAEAGELGELTVSTMIDEWLLVVGPRWSKRYRQTVDDNLARFIIPSVGGLACCDLRKSHVRNIISQGNTAEVRRSIRATLSSLIGWGSGEDWLDKSKDLVPPKERGQINAVTFIPVDEIPEAGDVESLAIAMGNPRQYASKHARTFTPPKHWSLMVLVAAYCGLRQGEVFALRGKDIAGGMLTVDEQVQEIKGEGLVFSPPKGRKSRTVPIPTMAGSFTLRVLLEAQAAAVGPEGLLFPAPEGGPWRKGGFNRRALGPGKAASGYRWTFHALRHFYCRWLLSAGVDAKDVSLMAGHSSVQTTLNLYVGHSASALDRVKSIVG